MAEQTPHVEQTRNRSGSIAPDYFDRLYAAAPDPWDFEKSAYEAEKYAATLAALPRPSYQSALEPGCSIGVLTQQLAPRCEHLLALEVSAAALEQARQRCAGLGDITFQQGDLGEQFPAGPFDLILLSEIAYYFSFPDLEKLRARIAAALAPGGHLLLVHYTGETNYPLTADTVHDAFLGWPDAPWEKVLAQRNAGYRLELLERRR